MKSRGLGDVYKRQIYGPLSNGVTQVIYEGVPNAPHPGRHFEVIERYRVTSYYTAPTLIRSLKGWHPDGIPAHADGGPDLSSIRLIGTVGEAVNPEAWTWARTQIGRDTPDLPMVDTWWQLSLIHISEPTRLHKVSRMPSSA